jgi:hypothetical protein
MSIMLLRIRSRRLEVNTQNILKYPEYSPISTKRGEHQHVSTDRADILTHLESARSPRNVLPRGKRAEFRIRDSPQ